MRYLVVGTAGHVDHGKTTLIKALTGIDTDRLREEKERGISIALGFAYLDLPNGRRAGIVDVPGHEKFVRHMLAGVGGIDMVLLVIAADEGVMPQTREHLDIIHLLGIERGVVVLTKTDLVEPDWLELVEAELGETLAGTALENAPLARVSGVTGEGLDDLVKTIGSLAEEVPDRPASGLTRLPVDRIFSMTGFGTVVTGTLIAGSLKVGDAIEVMPGGTSARVRTLQVHGEKVEQAFAGQRVAVNLAGKGVESFSRGDVLTMPGGFEPTRRLDVKLSLLKHAARPLKNRGQIRFHLGAAEILGRAVLLDRDELAQGDACHAQILLEEPTIAARGDRFVVRSYSPIRAYGGGKVLDPTPTRRHKRFRASVLERLATLEEGSPTDIVHDLLREGAPMSEAELAAGTGLDAEQVSAACRELEEREALRRLPGGEHVLEADCYARSREAVLAALRDHHRRYPLREGYPIEELRARMLPAFDAGKIRDFLQALVEEGEVSLNPQSAALRELDDAEPPAKLREVLAGIEEAYRAGGLQPPEAASVFSDLRLDEALGQECLHYLVRRDALVRVDKDWCFDASAVRRARELIVEHLRVNEEMSASEARDLLGTSRKYTVPLLEYLDATRVTKRVGDKRRLLGQR